MQAAIHDPTTSRSAWPEPGTPVSETQLNISVVFTTEEATAKALETAVTLANRLGARITLLAPQVVSYHLPIDQPQILRDWNENRLRALAASCPVETTVCFYLCRNAAETLIRRIRPHSLIVIGTKKRWWPTAETSLAKRLRQAGHEVLLTELE